jgi:hypothetical protein
MWVLHWVSDGEAADLEMTNLDMVYRIWAEDGCIVALREKGHERVLKPCLDVAHSEKELVEIALAMKRGDQLIDLRDDLSNTGSSPMMATYKPQGGKS